MALTDNILAYWKLDGNSNDSVASNNGTDTSITYSAGNGLIVQGAGFDGSTSKIALSTTAFGTTSTFSVSMWIKHSSFASRQGLFVKASGVSNVGACFWIEVSSVGTNNISFGVMDSGLSGATATSSGTVTDGVWNHVVCTCDGTNQKVYINGSLSNTTACAGATINNITMDTTLGYWGSYASLPYGGAMDEVGFWSGKALDSTEVTQLYNSGAGLSYPFTSTNTTRLTLLNVS